MKKLFAVLLTLLLVAVLPVVAMAEETVAETTVETAVETTVETAAETTVETAADTAVETDEEGVEIMAPETEAVTDEGPKTTFGFFPATLGETLPIMGMGMLGIFLVTCVIILAVVVLSKLGGKKDEE
jgi:hypothetical protein